jgi:hypothetical protein
MQLQAVSASCPALRMSMPVVMAVLMTIDHVACWIMALGSRGGLRGDRPADNRHRHLAHAQRPSPYRRGASHHMIIRSCAGLA